MNEKEKQEKTNQNDLLLINLITKSLKEELEWKSASRSNILLIKNSDEDYSSSEYHRNRYMDYLNFYETSFKKVSLVITREVFIGGGPYTDYYSGLYILQNNSISKRIYGAHLEDSSLLDKLFRIVETSKKTNIKLLERLIDDLTNI